MWRWLSVALCIAAITLLEFRYFPGHSYLQLDSQIFVPMLERLAAPTYLSRDAVATSPHLVFTAYDEATLLLRGLFHRDFETVLAIQQVLCRGSAVLGTFLLASSVGLRTAPALLVSAVVNLGASLPGVLVSVTEQEPVPHAFAFGLSLLALGLIAKEKPLLSGVVGGIALLYHPPVAGAFWAAVVICFICDRQLRRLLRPMLTILFIFVLLLANLAQLQPGVVDTHAFFKTISYAWLGIQRERTPEVLISTWPGRAVLFYLGVFLGGFLAATRLWPSVNRQSKWLGTILLFMGLFSIPVSGFLGEVFHWSLIPQIQPARMLLFTVALSLTAAAIAASRAFTRKRTYELAVWSAFVLCIVFGTQRHALSRTGDPAHSPITEVALWAKENTWGGSMFLFPDAGRDDYPGIFRAESIRSVYVDWSGGELVKYFQDFAEEWKARWTTTMTGSFSSARLQQSLDLPVDYYVLRQKHAVRRARPAFATNEFVVYERNDLKNAGTPLQLISGADPTR